MPDRHRIVAGTILALALGAWACGEKPDISETKAQAIAEKEMLGYCGAEGGKCSEFFSKGSIAPPDARFKWAYQWTSEFAEPRRKLVVMVGRKGETSVMLENLPPLTAEESAALAAIRPPAAAAPESPAGPPASETPR